MYVCIVTPLEMIKVRQQTDLMNAAHERKYHGLISTTSSIIRNEGYATLKIPKLDSSLAFRCLRFLSLYSGLAATVVRQSWGKAYKEMGTCISGIEG